MNTSRVIVAILITLAATFFALLSQVHDTHEARLIGYCDGRLLAAMEEDDFPAGCDWIDVIRYEP